MGKKKLDSSHRVPLCYVVSVCVLRKPVKTVSISPKPTTSHTLIISFRDKLKTVQQILEQLKEGVDARKLDIGVQRLRKARSQEVFVIWTPKKDAEAVGGRLKSIAGDLVIKNAARRLP